MKERFLLLCLLCALFLPSIAQRWRPLLPGNLHFFQSPSNYSIRIDSVGEVNGDSTFWLNDIAGPRPPGCSNYYHYFPGLEGFWGDRFVELSGGVFAFISRAGDSAIFHTLAPVGGSWAFGAGGNLTATLSSRSVSSFLGIQDSMITIDISDGKQFQFSEHHGMVAGVNMGYYLSGGNPMVSTLYELPEVPDFKRFYTWQPGDRYGASTRSNGVWSGYDEFHQYTFLTRTESPAGDSLTFTLQDRGIQLWYSPNDTVPFPTDTITKVITRHEMEYLGSATYELYADSLRYYWQLPWILGGFNSRMEVPFYYGPSQGILDTCGFTPLVMFPEQTQLPLRFIRGLGLTTRNYLNGTHMTGYSVFTYTMDCYAQVGQDSVWPCAGAYILLSAASPVAMNASLTPWLNATRGSQGIQWEGLAPGEYQLELLDMNGRQLWRSKAFMLEAGNLELPAGLPQGICLLRLSSQDGNWAAMVKVPVLRN